MGAIFSLEQLLTDFGYAGRRMAEIGASEGGAGNLSVYLGWPVDPQPYFPNCREIDLPVAIPGLAGKSFLVSGSGQRLNEIHLRPTQALGLVTVLPGGERGLLYTAQDCQFERPTSEFNSHLAVHADQVLRSGADFHALVHAQPPFLTFLSHIERYRDAAYLNQRLLRWQPETVMNFPEGVGIAPFEVPGSAALMRVTVETLREKRLIVWAQHGALARSFHSIKHAADAIEYIEASAHYEYLNLLIGEPADGLNPAQLKSICSALHIAQSIYPEG